MISTILRAGQAGSRSRTIADQPPAPLLTGLPNSTVRTARTLRRRLITIAGRLTRHGRSWTLHLPARWPWHGDSISALAEIRALPAA